jgi:Probable zinc-ribbon domain
MDVSTSSDTSEDYLTRLCRECVQPFRITQLDRRRLQALGLSLPATCRTCRAKRQRGLIVVATTEPIQLTCGSCGGTFIFTVRQQQCFAERCWVAPKRCDDCRAGTRSGG